MKNETKPYKILLRKIKSLFIRIGLIFKKGFFAVGRTVSLLFATVKCLAAVRKKRPMPGQDQKDRFDAFLPDRGRLETELGFSDPASIDLSVIVAAYNAEAYIRECLDSVLQQQTKYDLEIILVNDGSTDGTKAKIADYLSDPRVRYYEQPNSGQAAARNFAIRQSVGKYVMILDSDDLLSAGSIDHLMDLALKTGSEIAEGAIQRFYDSFALQPQKKIKAKTLEGAAKDKFILKSYGYSVAKVYKRELWEQVRYPIGYIFEDVISKFVLRRLAKRVAVTNRIVYGYRWNFNSTSHGTNQKKKLDSILVFPQIVRICEQNHIPKDRVFYLLALNHVGILNHATIAPFQPEERKLCFFRMRDQLRSIQNAEKGKLPFWFSLLEKAILDGNFEAWDLTANTIRKYGRLAKCREIN